MKPISFIVIVLISAKISSVSGTQVKWTGNPDGPEAAKVPRSQKYWDENNIERPDYAKTDAELREERKHKKDYGASTTTATHEKTDSGGINVKKLVFIIGFFLGVWVLIFRKAMKGHRLGSSTSTKVFSFGKLSDGMNLEEKARLARLAKFEGKKEN